MPSKDSNIFAFFGTDEARVKEAALQLAEKIAPKDDEFGMDIVNGSADNAEGAVRIVGQTIEAIQTLPFFGGEKVVWLQGANFFGDSQTGKAQSTVSATDDLLALLEAGLPPDVKFILSASEVDKRRTFYKKIGKIGKLEIFDRIDTSRPGWEKQVLNLVSARSREMGLIFEGDAMERFVLNAGADTRTLESEMEKLSLYAGDRPVTIEDIRRICATSHTGAIFEIGDAIARRDLPSAMELIDIQMRRGENAIGILLAAIVPKIRNLLQAKDLTARNGIRVGRDFKGFEAAIGRLPASEVAHLPRKKDGNVSVYPLFLAAKDVGSFSLNELRNALDACLEANLRLVTTQLEPRLVLHQLVARILGG